MNLKIGDRVVLVVPDGEKRRIVRVTQIDPDPKQERSIEVEVTGSEWFYPHRIWVRPDEIKQ